MLTDQSIQIDYDKLEERDRNAFDKRLTQKISILNKHLLPSAPDRLKIRIQQPKQRQFAVDMTLFNHTTLHSSGRGNTIVIALETAFTPLKENLLQHKEKMKDQQNNNPRQHRSELLNQAFGNLNSYVLAQDRKAFNRELVPLLNDLLVYIKRHLRYAHLTGLDKEKRVISAEVLNQTVESAYENFDAKKVDLSLEHWLFFLADEVMDRNLRESEFEQAHIDDWDDYISKALSGMDEIIAMSAEGIPELVEDLDESDEVYNLMQEQIGLTVDYEQDLSNKEQAERIMKVLAKTPGPKRKIFELNTIEGFTVDEIARMHGMKKSEVEESINYIRDYVRKNIQ